MKYLILALILTIISCSKPQKKHSNTPERVIRLFHNPYKGGFSLDSVYQLLKDTFKFNEDHKPIFYTDTIIYISIPTTYLDPKDTTHKTLLKGKDGKDSTQLLFYPITPKEIIHPKDLE